MPNNAFNTRPSSAKILGPLCAVLLLATCGCADFTGGPEGPLIAPPDSAQSKVQRLLVSETGTTLEPFEFSDILSTPDTTIIVDFWASWCGPCKMLSPELERVAKSRSDDVIVVKVNVDQHPELAQHFEVGSIPDVMIFRDGKAIDRLIGFRSADQILARLHGIPDPSVSD